MSHQGQLGEFSIEKCCFMFLYTFMDLYFVFHQKTCVFIILIYVFCGSIKLQQKIKQSETRIGDKTLSVKLCVWKKVFTIHFEPIYVESCCKMAEALNYFLTLTLPSMCCRTLPPAAQFFQRNK